MRIRNSICRLVTSAVLKTVTGSSLEQKHGCKPTKPPSVRGSLDAKTTSQNIGIARTAINFMNRLDYIKGIGGCSTNAFSGAFDDASWVTLMIARRERNIIGKLLRMLPKINSYTESVHLIQCQVWFGRRLGCKCSRFREAGLRYIRRTLFTLTDDGCRSSAMKWKQENRERCCCWSKEATANPKPQRVD